MEQIFHQPHQLLSFLVEILDKKGFDKKYIAGSIGIAKSDSKVLFKLCNDTIKNHKKTSTTQYVENLLSYPEFDKFFYGDISTEKYVHTFIMYYWSRQREVRLALIGINKDNPDQGDLQYLTKSENGFYEILRQHKIESFRHIDLPVIEFLVRKESGISSFIVANKATQELDKLRITFCSFTSVLGTSHDSYSGIGILEKIEPAKVKKSLMYLRMNGIPFPIVNALYRKRLDVESNNDVLLRYEDIRAKQLKPIEEVVGYYVGFYPRWHIGEGNDTGGLALVIMSIQNNGIINVYYKSDEAAMKNIKPDYSGMITFPHSDNESIIVGELEYYKRTHRIRFILTYGSSKLKGCFSGWRKKGGIFARAILFKKIEHISNPDYNEVIELLMKQYKPKGIEKSKVDHYDDILNELRAIEQTCIHTIDLCIGADKGLNNPQLKMFNT